MTNEESAVDHLNMELLFNICLKKHQTNINYVLKQDKQIQNKCIKSIKNHDDIMVHYETRKRGLSEDYGPTPVKKNKIK